MKKCNNCKYRRIDGWIEKYVCCHPKFPLGKVIIEMQDDSPKWCPSKKSKGDIK
jgi:hypothetical protein